LRRNCIPGRVEIDLAHQVADQLLDLGIVSRDGQRRAVLRQGLGKLAQSMMRFSESFDGGEVLGRALQDLFELPLGVFALVELQKRSSQGDAGGLIRRMNGKPGTRRVGGLAQLSGAAVLLGKLCKRNRRRVLLDPPSKAFKTRVVGHLLIFRRLIAPLRELDLDGSRHADRIAYLIGSDEGHIGGVARLPAKVQTQRRLSRGLNEFKSDRRRS